MILGCSLVTATYEGRTSAKALRRETRPRQPKEAIKPRDQDEPMMEIASSYHVHRGTTSRLAA
jgi:hypothetical protein